MTTNDIQTQDNIEIPRKKRRGVMPSEIEETKKIVFDVTKGDVHIHTYYYVIDGIIYMKTRKGDYTEMWPKEYTPKVLRCIKVKDINAIESTGIIFYDVEINGYESRLSIDDLSTGKYIKKFPTIHSVFNRTRRDIYADVINILSQQNDVPVYDGVFNVGVYKDEKTNQYYRLLPNGDIRCLETSNTVLLIPLSTRFSSEQWQERKEYVKPDSKQQSIDYDFFKWLSPNSETLLTIVHNIGTLLSWLHNSGFKHGNALNLVAEQNTGKTSIARIGLCVLYPYSDEYNGDANFEMTPIAVINILCKLDHTPSLLDDKHMDSVSTKTDKQILYRIERSIYNKDSARTVSQRSGKDNVPDKLIRTYTMVTSEDMTDIEDSLRTRCLILNLVKQDIDKSTKGKYSLLKIPEHINSVYVWGDTIDTYMLKMVNEQGYDNIVTQMTDKYQKYREEIWNEITKNWKEEYNSIASDIDRLSFIGAYYYTIADIMQEQLCLPFLHDIKQIVLKSIYNQLQVMNVPTSIDGTNAVLAGIYEMLDSILHHTAFDNGKYYKIEFQDGIKTFFQLERYKGEADTILYEFEDCFLLTSLGKKQLLNTTEVKAIPFKSKSDRDKIHELSIMLKDAGEIAMSDKDRIDYSKKLKGKKITGLALKKDIIINKFKIDGDNIETNNGVVKEAIDVIKSLENIPD